MNDGKQSDSPLGGHDGMGYLLKLKMSYVYV